MKLFYIPFRTLTTSSMDEIAHNLKSVNDKIRVAFDSAPSPKKFPRLVAVTKTKPIEAILAAYSAGQRHFGENYVNELIEKANDERITTQCAEIQWHFIGTLQKSNVSKLCSKVPNLFVVETVESEILANYLQKKWKKLNKVEPLNIFLQINTSDEEQKSGVTPSEASQLANYVKNNCDLLSLKGFMTIGSVEQSLSGQELNTDFAVLAKVRQEFCQNNNVDVTDFELSMGMSADFETAIKMGSTNVRIGSTIFGTRDYSAKQ